MSHIVAPNEKMFKYVYCYHCKVTVAYLNTDVEAQEFVDMYENPYDKHYIVCPACEKRIYLT